MQSLSMPNIMPQDLLNKELPPTPPPQPLSDLELENELLRKQITVLRTQIGLHINQVNQHRQTTNSLKLVAAEVMSSIQPLQDAIFAMKVTEKMVHEKVEALLESCGEALKVIV